MAAERNNTANKFQRAAEGEFDLMLRRHLQHGGALVAACTGFDADTANAYVERALTSAAQSRYEAHLAGCPSCRRHVVELARMLPVEAVPVAAPARLPQWKGTVAGWFSQWDWRWAGTAAAAACALFIAVLGVHTMRQASAPSERMVAQKAHAVAQSAPEPQATPVLFSAELAAQSAAPSSTSLALNTPAEAGTLGKEEKPKEAVVPALATPARAIDARAEANEKLLTFSSAEAASRPLPPPTVMQAPPAPPLIASERSSAPANSQIAQLTSLGQSVGGPYSSQSGGFVIAMRQSARQDAAPVAPPSELMKRRAEAEILNEDLNLSAKAEAQDSKEAPKADAASRERSARSLKSALKGKPVFGLLPGRDSDEARTKEAKTSTEEPALKPLFKRVNGKTLFFEHGMWIDQNYKAEAKLPLIRLVRGSKEYQQTVIENPSLAQFFDLGQVIVVWKGKVYEVRR